MKNHRSVCAASEAGFIEYAGLPGTVKTGCTNTPCQKSRFCNLHKPRTLSTETARPNSVIEMILEKKTTRSQTMYKVKNYYVTIASTPNFQQVNTSVYKKGTSLEYHIIFSSMRGTSICPVHVLL